VSRHGVAALAVSACLRQTTTWFNKRLHFLRASIAAGEHRQSSKRVATSSPPIHARGDRRDGRLRREVVQRALKTLEHVGSSQMWRGRVQAIDIEALEG
jgi:hypothetical protein